MHMTKSESTGLPHTVHTPCS